MRQLDISEVSNRSGIPISTLHYYEQRGLIAPSGRRGLRRQYQADVLERLALIGLGRTVGFSLTDIAQMFGPDGVLDLHRDRLDEKADEIDMTIRRLTAIRDGLRHAAACPAPSHLECPTFRRILRAAGAGAFRPRPTSAAPHDT
ncbi:MAG: helix-turn-helix domain-containing protein [Pseudomonadota bacterium]